MAYDGNGAPTTYKSNVASYDREERLVGYGSAFTAKYRADGLRAWRQVSGVRRYFLYDGGNPVVEPDTSGNIAAVNVFGPEGLVSRQEGGSSLHYLFDWQGSLAQKVSGSGAVLEHCWNKPYGAGSRAGTLQQDPWGYSARSGYYLDRSTGLYLCKARFWADSPPAKSTDNIEGGAIWPVPAAPTPAPGPARDLAAQGVWAKRRSPAPSSAEAGHGAANLRGPKDPEPVLSAPTRFGGHGAPVRRLAQARQRARGGTRAARRGR